MNFFSALCKKSVHFKKDEHIWLIKPIKPIKPVKAVKAI